jgi:hypothetical protein
MGERNVLFVADPLSGKHQHKMLHPRIVDGLECHRIERAAHIHPPHLGANRGCNLRMVMLMSVAPRIRSR